MPDLGELNGPEPRKQHVVDHGFFQSTDGTWRLWACIRGTGVSRLLFGWRGESLEQGPWRPIGVVARAEAKYGEQIRQQDGKRVETMGAPYFVRDGDRILCFYHSAGIRLMTSPDGVEFKRADLGGERGNLLYRDGGRDVMVLKIGDLHHAYSTVSTSDGHGYVILKTSPDLKTWSETKIVSRGGVAGDGPVSAESPFVVALDGYYYLFRASSITFKTYVYRSTDPTDFGVNDDSKLIATLPIKAPELIHHEGRWYISDLADFQGVKLARLNWPRDDR
ncbi:MAG: hypothetical protein RIC55_15545 [Pirellulaceae bacterium]